MFKGARIGGAAAAAALALQGCSSMPREFSPVLAAAPDDQAAYQAAYQHCRQMIAEGKDFRKDRGASTGAGVAAGVATGAAGTAIASGAAGWSGIAAMGATIVLAPFAIAGGAWGMAKAKKLKKERAVQEATAECLAQDGYQVADWERVSARGR